MARPYRARSFYRIVPPLPPSPGLTTKKRDDPAGDAAFPSCPNRGMSADGVLILGDRPLGNSPASEGLTVARCAPWGASSLPCRQSGSRGTQFVVGVGTGRTLTVARAAA